MHNVDLALDLQRRTPALPVLVRERDTIWGSAALVAGKSPLEVAGRHLAVVWGTRGVIGLVGAARTCSKVTRQRERKKEAGARILASIPLAHCVWQGRTS